MLLLVSIGCNVYWILLVFGSSQEHLKADSVVPANVFVSTTSNDLSKQQIDETEAPERLRLDLVAHQIPEEAVNAILKESLYRDYRTMRVRLLNAAIARSPRWRVATSQNLESLLSEKERRDLYNKQIESRARSLAILGPNSIDPDGRIAAQYSFLSAENAIKVEWIQSDYRELADEQKRRSANLSLPLDMALSGELKQNLDADLRSLISPEEINEVNLRTSKEAESTRAAMAVLGGTEDEYRLISGLASLPPAEREAKLRRELGDDRFRQYQASQLEPVQELYEACCAVGLPHDTAVRAGVLLLNLATESERMQKTSDAQGQQRLDGLGELSSDVQEKIAALLGRNEAQIYLKKSAPWVYLLGTGTTVQINNGKIVTMGRRIKQ